MLKSVCQKNSRTAERLNENKNGKDGEFRTRTHHVNRDGSFEA